MADSHVEAYLKKLNGDDADITFEPQSNVELYLASMNGMDVELPEEPGSRVASYFAKLSGEDVDISFEPQSRVERYLADKNGLEVDVPPEPLSRVEELLIGLEPGGEESIYGFYFKELSCEKQGTKRKLVMTVYLIPNEGITPIQCGFVYTKNSEYVANLEKYNASYAPALIGDYDPPTFTLRIVVTNATTRYWFAAVLKYLDSNGVEHTVYHSINNRYSYADDFKPESYTWAEINNIAQPIEYNTRRNPTIPW